MTAQNLLNCHGSSAGANLSHCFSLALCDTSGSKSNSVRQAVARNIHIPEACINPIVHIFIIFTSALD